MTVESWNLLQGDLVIYYSENVTRHDWQSGQDEVVTEKRILRLPVTRAFDLRDFLFKNLEGYAANLREEERKKLAEEIHQKQLELNGLRVKLADKTEKK